MSKRVTITEDEQLPKEQTISLREKHLGKSCKLFFRADPLKIVRAKGMSMFYSFPSVIPIKKCVFCNAMHDKKKRVGKIARPLTC